MDLSSIPSTWWPESVGGATKQASSPTCTKQLPPDERSGHSAPLSILTPCLVMPNTDGISCSRRAKERKPVLNRISKIL